VAISAGLIGSPLTNSFSPRLFELFAARAGEKYSYSLLKTGPAGLGRALKRIKTSGWDGFNVTLPLKEKIIPFLDALSPEAKAIGAVNAVLITNGGLEGHNTDAFAVKFALKEAGCRLHGRAGVVWGAGGAAKAAAWVLAAGGAAAVEIRSRSVSRGAELAKRMSAAFPKVSFASKKFSGGPGGNFTVFVNATPLGMYAPLPPALRRNGPPGSFYLDFAYAPGLTPFLENRDGVIIPGTDLLLYQALKSAELFGGRRVKSREIVELKNSFRKDLRSWRPHA